MYKDFLGTEGLMMAYPSFLTERIYPMFLQYSNATNIVYMSIYIALVILCIGNIKEKEEDGNGRLRVLLFGCITTIFLFVYSFLISFNNNDVGFFVINVGLICGALSLVIISAIMAILPAKFKQIEKFIADILICLTSVPVIGIGFFLINVNNQIEMKTNANGEHVVTQQFVKYFDLEKYYPVLREQAVVNIKKAVEGYKGLEEHQTMSKDFYKRKILNNVVFFTDKGFELSENVTIKNLNGLMSNLLKVDLTAYQAQDQAQAQSQNNEDKVLNTFKKAKNILTLNNEREIINNSNYDLLKTVLNNNDEEVQAILKEACEVMGTCNTIETNSTIKNREEK